MPYKSEEQRKFMHMKHPDIAERWDEEMKERAAGKKEKPHQSRVKSAAQKHFGGKY